ncbi:MAG: T9SS type A sorting domain-containing protein [Flavobacteriales bacterium]|nr:T9SS type A sorting domain-containing protein [Flavobacteriales bacterium]
MTNQRIQLIGAVLATTSVCTAQSPCLDRYLTDPLTYTNIVTASDEVSQPRDLDFKPNSNELWVLNKGTSNGSSVVIVHHAGMPEQTEEYRKDTHSGHFTITGSAMAFSENGEWAAVSEVQSTAGGNSTFMGPALWSGDPNIYAEVFQNNWVNGQPLGSHLDMLHQSPFSMGIAADSAKVYWVMDGHNGNICRYDYVEDHGPGYDDHGAGKIWRYTDVPVTRVANMPSHMVMDRENGWLYFIDGGTKQIKRLNVNSGDVTGNLAVPATAGEPLAGYYRVEGAVVEVVDTWTTGQPCGIDYMMGRLIVSDNSTGDIKMYDVMETPMLMGTIVTGQPGIMGLVVGHDGSIYFANYTGNKVVRIGANPMPDDASIMGIISPEVIATTPNYFSTDYTICSGSIAPVVRLQNSGTNDIMMVDIHYHLDDGSASMYSWTGMLTPGTSVDVTLPNLNVENGAHLLNVWTSMPNGNEDMNPINDQLSGSFRAVQPVQSVPFNEDFNSTTFPPAGWNYVHFNPNNLMTRSTTSAFGAGSGSLKMDHYSGQMDITGQLDHMLVPRVDLSTATLGTTLDFAVAYKQYNATSNERLMVKASTDCGDTWETLYDKAGSTLSTVAAGTSAFTPTAAQWRTEYVDISSVLGETDVLFMFVTESNFGNNMYLDNIRIANTVGVEENGMVSFSLYPNPANETVNLSVVTTEGFKVEAYNALGALAHSWSFTGSATAITLDVSSLANGVYSLVLRTATSIGARPLVVRNH